MNGELGWNWSVDRSLRTVTELVTKEQFNVIMGHFRPQSTMLHDQEDIWQKKHKDSQLVRQNRGDLHEGGIRWWSQGTQAFFFSVWTALSGHQSLNTTSPHFTATCLEVSLFFFFTFFRLKPRSACNRFNWACHINFPFFTGCCCKRACKLFCKK